ncbi:MAG TPA: hypothetical protein VNQ80_10580 [Parapedobacter sp.]|nr:hypothetical protein [Parapedobacter sp.]
MTKRSYRRPIHATSLTTSPHGEQVRRLDMLERSHPKTPSERRRPSLRRQQPDTPFLLDTCLHKKGAQPGPVEHLWRTRETLLFY